MPEVDLPHAPRWVAVASRVIQALPAGRYRAMNWVARQGRGPFWARLPADLGGLMFGCDLRDVLMREVCFTGRYEPQETSLMADLLRPGMTFVDVGANWGYFTLLAAHLVGAGGRVISVEADPRACRALRANVDRNALKRVSVVAAAAADRPGSLMLRSYGSESTESANFGVTLAANTAGGDQSFEIETRPLDAILDEANVGRVDLLKMDIEGAEERALQGLQRRLGVGNIDRIILELHPAHLRDQGRRAEAVVERVRAHGYRAWHIDHSPDAHRRAASGVVAASTLLAPVADPLQLGEWPHLLFVREGLPTTRSLEGGGA
jgi:FkbM family methyltransferase